MNLPTNLKKTVLFYFAIIISMCITYVLFYNLGVRHKITIETEANKQKMDIKAKEVAKAKEVHLVKEGNEIKAIINMHDNKKIAYLTFDDGPSPNNTPKILNTLKKYNIKATFFIIGKNAERNPGILIREKNEGHEIAIHSYCHIPSIIYKNSQAYLNDINQCSMVIKSIVGANGYENHLIRFPEGSTAVSEKFREDIGAAGYIYVDWNSLVGDAEKPRTMPTSYLINRLKSTTYNDHVVILMHDAAAKDTTSEALPQVIEYLKSKGYSFDVVPA